ncbi:MAG: hypothetical protein AB9842_07290 [Bacteroidales bacterium]
MRTIYFCKISLLTAFFVLISAACKKDKDDNTVTLGGSAKNHIDKYVNGVFVGKTWSFEDLPWGIATTANGKKIWIITQYKLSTHHGGELKQGNENGNFSTIDSFEDDPNAVALSADGSLGYVVTDAGNLCKYVNGTYVGHIHKFDNKPVGVSCSADGKKVWVVTKYSSGIHTGGELKQGDQNGNFNTIDTFSDYPVRVALSADGSLGYVITDGNNVCKYVNGVYMGHIWSAGSELRDIACQASGKVIWVIWLQKLMEGDENGNFKQIDTFSDPSVGVALSADGSLGYVITQDE